ncbi:MFS transporter [Candidatus Woesearchaeota archaeon]|nr:MFS transporter [Candidatus Woesearchaeota archaeon]
MIYINKSIESKCTKLPLYKKISKSLDSCRKETAVNALMTGFSSSYITPFALAMDASAGFISILFSLPEFLGSLIQLFTLRIINIFSRKKILLASVVVESFLWLPIVLTPFIDYNRLYLLLLLIVLQYSLRFLQEPIYNSILGDWIPANQRGMFFGRRQKIIGILTSAGAFIAGFILNSFSNVNKISGFVIIFIISMVLRFISTKYIGGFYIQKYVPTKRSIPFYSFIKNIKHDNFGNFVLYISFFKLCVAIASPFFAVYMLEHLRLSYMEFTLVTLASIIARFLLIDFWGKLIDKQGSRSILILSGLFIPIIPIAWIFFRQVFALFMLQFISGFLWAGFDLASSSYLFDSTSRKDRITLNSYHNFIRSLGTFSGALLSIVLLRLPLQLYQNKLLFLFFVSGALRFIATFIFGLKIREARLIEVKVGGDTNKQHINIYPSPEVMFQLVDKKGRIKTASYKRN